MEVPAEWSVCRDDRHGFSLRHPPEWRSTTDVGTCAQFQAGRGEEPHGLPDVDVFLQVRPLEGTFPGDYLATGSFVAGGVTYTDREEIDVGGLPAVRARFQSGGPVPNSGVEYAVRNGDRVLRTYVSQPAPDIESQFRVMVESLQW